MWNSYSGVGTIKARPWSETRGGPDQVRHRKFILVLCVFRSSAYCFERQASLLYDTIGLECIADVFHLVRRKQKILVPYRQKTDKKTNNRHILLAGVSRLLGLVPHTTKIHKVLKINLKRPYIKKGRATQIIHRKKQRWWAHLSLNTDKKDKYLNKGYRMA